LSTGRAGLALAILCAALAAGCSNGTQINSASVVDVYVSLPMRGPSGPEGRDAADGARLALSQAGGRAGGLRVHAVYLDDTVAAGTGVGWSAPRVARNARRATEDSQAIAYIGDFESGATRASEPITNEANLLQVSPASTAVELTRPFAGSEDLPTYEQGAKKRTFGRVIPDDDEQGRAMARWLEGLHVGSVSLSGDGSSFSRNLTTGFRNALGGIRVNPDSHWTLFTGEAPAAASVVRQRRSGEHLLGSDAVLPPWSGTNPAGIGLATSAALDPSQLPPSGKQFVSDFRARYGRSPGRYAAYGYEAMAVVLDSIDRAATDTISRQAVIDAFFETADRHSILGTYSIDAVGNTTLDSFTGYRVEGTKLAPTAGIRAN
jgi:branched-chain amino acid transport system substrate-binding protein